MTLETIGPLAFLSIFHVIGGAALGATVRAWLDSPTRQNLGRHVFFLIWGGMFGCMPLAFGLQEGGWMVVAQSAVLVTAFAVPFFWRDRLRELASQQFIIMLVFGGVFLVAGLVAGGAMLREGEWLVALLFGGIFSLVGGGIFFGGLKQLFSDPADDG
jgi:hypothetical protein